MTFQRLGVAIAMFAFAFAATPAHAAPDKAASANHVDLTFTNSTPNRMQVWTFGDNDECKHKNPAQWIAAGQSKVIEIAADQKISLYAGQTEFVQMGISVCQIVVTFDTASGNKYLARYLRYGTGCKIGVATEPIDNDDMSKIMPVKLIRRRYESPWYGGGAVCKKLGSPEQQLTQDEEEGLFTD